MTPKHILMASTLTWATILALIAFIVFFDADASNGADLTTTPIPQHAPRTITAHDGSECKLWPLEREYATTDPVFFWLCPGAGEKGRDTWGLAWDFRDVNAETKGD